jgi:hypothetical protein
MMNRVGLELLGLLRWWWRPLRVFATGLVVSLLGAAMLRNLGLGSGHAIGLAGVFMMLAGLYMLLVRRFLVPDGTPLAALVAVDLAAVAFVAGFPSLLVVLATAGASASGHAGPEASVWVSVLSATGALMCFLLIVFVVVVVPGRLRRRGRAMGDVPERAAVLFPSWLAATAAVATWGYIFLLRFGRGVLSGSGFGTLAVGAGAVAVAVLMVPAYQFVARSCWERGLENMLDPVRWREAVREVFRALRDPAAAAVADAAGAEATTAAEEPYPA